MTTSQKQPESKIVTAMRNFIIEHPEHGEKLTPLADDLENKIEQLARHEVDVQAVIGAWARARIAYTNAARKHVMED